MGIISNSDLTELMEWLNEMLGVKCLAENIKTVTIIIANEKLWYLEVLYIDIRHYICITYYAVRDTKYNVWSLISIYLQSVEGEEFIRHSKKLVTWALFSREKESPQMGDAELEMIFRKKENITISSPSKLGDKRRPSETIHLKCFHDPVSP